MDFGAVLDAVEMTDEQMMDDDMMGLGIGIWESGGSELDTAREMRNRFDLSHFEIRHLENS